jgi:hypothetical protein
MAKTEKKPRTKIIYREKKTEKVKRAVRRAGGMFASSGVGGGFKSALPVLAGMIFAKFVQRRFGFGGSEADVATWTWKDYLLAALAGVGGGVIAHRALGMSKDIGEKFMAGGLGFAGFKAAENYLIQKSPTATKFLGEDETPQLEGMGDTNVVPLIGEVISDAAGQGWQFNGTDFVPTMQLPETAGVDAGLGALIQKTALGGIGPKTQLGEVDSYMRAYRR